MPGNGAPLIQLNGIRKIFYTDEVETHALADVHLEIREGENVGMVHRAKHYPVQLSGGQQQRVAVARAVVGDPAILLADEPTGNLDSTNGEAVMELLRSLHRAGATVCMVTHDPRYAKHADRSIHLFDGRVVDEQGVGALGLGRSEEHTSELQSLAYLVCRLLLEKKKIELRARCHSVAGRC